MTLSFYGLSLDQCLPNFYRVVNSMIRLNNLYGLRHNHHDINFKYSICGGLKTSYYLKIHNPTVRLILCLFNSNRNSMGAFVKVIGNWHASELTCPMSHRQIGRYFYFPSTHSVGLRASSVRLRKRRFVNITTLMPYSRSWALPSWRVLMTLFVKCEKPIPTWTSPRLKLKTQSKPLLCPSPRRTLICFLLETQPLVTGS